ncbi:hypothetical protein G3M48_001762 [Beauveria asiatica]|uniref:Uncharacterized protein n=1 Tax=Beauveria asiatica TaxID=1069075 RepID=A0AAW0RFM9_9HYPO
MTRWSSPATAFLSGLPFLSAADIKFTAKTVAYYKNNGPDPDPRRAARSAAPRATTTTTTTGGPPPASLIINYWHYTGPATRENNVIMRGAALSDRRRFTQTTMPANEHDHSLGFLRHIRGNDGRGATAFPEPPRRGNQPHRLRRRDMRRRPGPALAEHVSGIMAGITTTAKFSLDAPFPSQAKFEPTEVNSRLIWQIISPQPTATPGNTTSGGRADKA